MASAPPPELGQVSPDGRWRWAGTRWVSAQPQSASRRGSRVWVWLVAGCLTILLLTGAGVGFAIYSRVQGFLHGTYTCLPSDFPRYPGSANADQIFELNGAYPGNTCHVVLESNDDVATVTAFYESKLNTGAWQVTSSATQGGKIIFQPAKAATPFGTVQVVVSNTHTEITIDTYTATCLPLNFPKYPGAKFGGMTKQTGEITGCHAVFVTNAGVAAVTAFYRSALNSGRWRGTSSAGNQGAWRLPNGKRTDASGTVRSSANGQGTEIDVDAYP